MPLEFLPEASFGLRVLSSPVSVYLSVCPCVCINHLLVCTITHQPFNLGSSNLHQRCKTPWLGFKIPIYLRDDLPWPSRSNLTWKLNFTSFWACPHDNLLPISARITKFGPQMHLSMVKILIALGDDRPWPSRSNLTFKSNFTCRIFTNGLMQQKCDYSVVVMELPLFHNKLMQSRCRQWQVNLIGVPSLWFYFYLFFRKLMVAHRMWVICVREDNNSIV